MQQKPSEGRTINAANTAQATAAPSAALADSLMPADAAQKDRIAAGG